MFDASQQPLDVGNILRAYYPSGSRTYEILMRHGELVARKALAAADRVPHLKPDRTFLMESSYLHDIGIFQTDTPDLGCEGPYPYIRHGVIGRKLLEQAGLSRHALVCERHVGVGITAEDIRRNALPLPDRDMIPVTIEEQIICYADKFYSKDGKKTSITRSVNVIRSGLARFGEHQTAVFDRWVEQFA